MSAISAGLFAGGVFLLWVVTGVIREVRAKLARRVADWLLPDGQAWTMRIAFGLAVFARWTDPDTSLSSNSPIINAFYSDLSNSPTADEALAELAADLREDERVIDPVRLMLPVVFAAVKARLKWSCGVLILAGIIWLTLAVFLGGRLVRRIRHPRAHAPSAH